MQKFWLRAKNVKNPSCVDLIPNGPMSFQDTVIIPIGLSDFHKML